MTRSNYIDYAKAFCIVFVVYIHVGFSAINSIVLFAMPAFFAATGFTFSYGKRSIMENISQRFKTTMIPYFVLMLFYTLTEIVRARLFGYGDASIAFPALANTVYGSGIIPFDGGVFDKLKQVMSYKAQPQNGVDLILPTNCHLWFLPAMFTASVFFVLLVKAARKNHLIKIASVLFLVFLASVEVIMPEVCQLPFGLCRGAIGAAFMLFGFWIRQHKLLEDKPKIYYLVTNLVAAILFVIVLKFGSDGSALVVSFYGPYGILSVFATFVGGVAGLWMVFSLFKAVEKLPFEKFKNLLSYAGKNVMTIYAWHMLFKFLFDIVYIMFIKSSDFSLIDDFKMGLMPQNSFWFMLFEGVAVIAICLLWTKFITKVKQLGKSKA